MHHAQPRFARLGGVHNKKKLREPIRTESLWSVKSFSVLIGSFQFFLICFKQDYSDWLSSFKFFSVLLSSFFSSQKWQFWCLAGSLHSSGFNTTKVSSVHFCQSCWDILKDYKILAEYLKAFTKATQGSPVGKNPLCWLMMSKEKNPAYGRHQLSRPMRIIEPIQIWRGCVIYL